MSHKAKIFLSAAFAMLISLCLSAEVRLPKLVSNGMVLQRDVPVKIWGWANAGEEVKLTFKNSTLTSKANADGTWQITLPAQKADGKSYSITINEHKLNNIIFGDVWLCSGQSNMELGVSQVLDRYRAEVENANNPLIRHFLVPAGYNFQQVERDFSGGEWNAVTPENILKFSAVAYFFAKELYDTYKIPIGLINASLGGSPAESWISEQSLQQFPRHVKALEKYKNQQLVDSIKCADNEREQAWHAALNKGDEGVGKWFKNDVDLSTWGTMTLPGYWADKGLGRLNGSVWFRKEFDVAPAMAGKPAELRLGCIVDADSTFVNGVFVGTTSYQYPSRNYSIPAGLLHEGKNSITIRVINSIGRGGFVPEKSYSIASDNDTLSLQGKWNFKVGAISQRLNPPAFIQWKPVGLYNAMIAPMLSYCIKGVIWYQGEANTWAAKEYETLFPVLIAEWRSKFNNPKMPFLYVQLANFMPASSIPAESGWAALRDVQRKTLKLPNTGMAVAIDIGEWNDIHPLNKKDVGHRLALWAKRIAYGDKKNVASGPLYKSMQVDGSKIILSFTELGSGFEPVQSLKGFAIAGKDGKYIWAKARIEKNKIVVWSDDVKEPKNVRYAWADNPEGANLRNKEGLPASPFTTE